MKKLVLSAAVVCALSLGAGGKNPEADFGLPALHVITDGSLAPAYGCRPPEEFQQGYQGTALFLSAYAEQRNSPDLLFNGACGAEDYFQAATAGDNMSLIADLGANVPLEEVSASRAFNLQRVHSFPAYVRFARVVKVEPNHTYAVLLNAHDKRGLFVFSVTEYVPNKKVGLRYAVKAYQVTPRGQTASAGFLWEQKNVR